MERNRESIEQIFEDNGGEAAVIGADDTGMISEQRTLVETQIADETAAETEDEGGEDGAT